MDLSRSIMVILWVLLNCLVHIQQRLFKQAGWVHLSVTLWLEFWILIQYLKPSYQTSCILSSLVELLPLQREQFVLLLDIVT